MPKFTNSGRLGELDVTTVTLDGTGGGTAAVTFIQDFITAPQVSIVAPGAGVNGTWTATSITSSGFTVSVSGATDVASQDVGVFWVAHEKGIKA